MIRRAKGLDGLFECKIFSPGEFVANLDESIREAEYRPATLAGSRRLIWERTGSAEFRSLYSVFGSPESGEKKSHFETQIRYFLADPKRFEVGHCKRLHEEKKLALVVYDRRSPRELVIPMLRISRSQIASTVFRYLLRRTVLISAEQRRLVVRIPEINILPDFEQAFIESGFMRGEQNWIKCSIPTSDISSNLCKLLKRMAEIFPFCSNTFCRLSGTLSRAFEVQDSAALAYVERKLWPGKILDANIPTYIVPIHPDWAQHLFDEGLAEQTLWGSKEDISLRNENVYYRSDRTSWPIVSPGRILWYVKQASRYHGSMCIRACSSLDEVGVGRATDIFSRFRRLGIYEWKEVLQTAKNQPKGPIMALRFSNTQLFKRPVKLKDLENILKEIEGKSPFLQAPQLINKESFTAIYRVATKS